MTPLADSSRAWRSHGFGIGLESAFAIAGCPPGSTNRRPVVRLKFASRLELASALGADETSVIAHRPGPGGRALPRLLAHPRDGYVISAAGHGVFHVSPRGDVVRCAPNAVAPWLWQRSLVGSVLPFVSALHGLEAIHASAVIPHPGAAAIALAAGSGGGKSSVAAELLLRGAMLLADDVTAVEPGQGGVIAHPALGLLSLKPEAARSLDRRGLSQLGHRVGADGVSVRLSVTRHEAPTRLGSIYFLRPAFEARSVRLSRMSPPDPRVLLGSTFNVALRTPERLVAQLEACAAIARSVRLVRVEVPPRIDFSVVAGRLLADAATAARPE